MAIEILAAFIAASALLALAPGPDNIFVLTQASLFGRRCGLLITLGLCTGLVFHTSLVALGVASLLLTTPWAFELLKVLGAGYLLYLAWRIYQTPPMTVPTEARLLSNRSLYLRGIIMNICNPKVTLFFLAYLPQFADPSRGHLARQIVLLGCIFALTALIVFSTIALLAGQLGAWLRQHANAQLYLNRITVLLFVVLALNLLISR